MTQAAASSHPFWHKEVKFSIEMALDLGEMKSSLSAVLFPPEWLLGKVHGLRPLLILHTNYSFCLQCLSSPSSNQFP